MMKKIIYPLMSALLVMAVASCTDYPEDWGFDVRLSSFDYTPVSATADSYDANLWAAIAVMNEGTGISEYGFEVNGEYLPGTIQRDGNYVYVTATAHRLSFNNNYGVSVVVKGENASISLTNSNYVSFSKDGLKAELIDGYLRMIDDHQLRVVSYFSLNSISQKPDVVMSFGGVNQTAVVDGDSAVAVFDLNQIDINSSTYVSVSATNIFGQSTSSISFSSFKYANQPSYMWLNTIRVDVESGVAEVTGSCDYNSVPNVVPEIMFTFMNQTQKGIKYNEYYGKEGSYTAYYRAQFNMNDLPVGTYTGSAISYKSIFYNRTLSRDNDVVEISACVSNPNDGDKGDYYQIDGVKWAKYDMSYNSNTGSLSVSTNNTSSYYSFGQYGNTTTHASTFWTSSVNPFAEYTVSGEFNVQGTGRDVVAANMSGWKLPMRSDFERLYNNTSIVAQVNDGNAINCYFFPSKNNRRYIVAGEVYPTDNTKANALNFYSKGVETWTKNSFYISHDVYSSSITHSSNVIYMTSEFRNVYGGSSVVYAAQLSSNQATSLELSFNNNMHVRPIKSY